MHRRPLLDLLDRYTARHPGEAETMGRFRTFVEGNPDCFNRSLKEGHITGSAWILDRTGDRVLLTHHRKLDRWLQPGGHADGDPDVLGVALREALEETGLSALEPAGNEIFDLDIHAIPPRGEEPEHFHYDVRFLLRDAGTGEFVVSEESHDLAWVALDDLELYTGEESMLRMCRKIEGHFRGVARMSRESGKCRRRNRVASPMGQCQVAGRCRRLAIRPSFSDDFRRIPSFRDRGTASRRCEVVPRRG